MINHDHFRIICGFAGVLYVRLYKLCFQVLHNLQQYRLRYAVVITFIISSITYPGFGYITAAVQLSNHQQVEELFSNFSWMKSAMTVREMDIVTHWSSNSDSAGGILLNLFVYCLYVVSVMHQGVESFDCF